MEVDATTPHFEGVQLDVRTTDAAMNWNSNAIQPVDDALKLKYSTIVAPLLQTH